MPSSEPHYERVMRKLRARIAAGEFVREDPAEDGKLPSTAQLATEYKVSKPTVRQAIIIMMTLGELRGQQGVGVFVVKQNPEERTDD